MSGAICVVGSINMDLFVDVPHFPRRGESVRGSDLFVAAGGKGANQAVAVARLGGRAQLVGAVGHDAWGAELKTAFASDGLDVSGVLVRDGVSTGAGLVAVVPGGENAIVVAPGANETLSPEDVDDARERILAADLLMLQNEIPPGANLRAVEIAESGETRVMLNAAPARDLPDELLGRVDVLVVNEVEARQLSGCGDDVSASGLARRLGARGPELVAVTLGGQGAVLFDGQSVVRTPSFAVEAVDSTGAGDAFCAGLALALLEGGRMETALRRACAAGALATTRRGALPSLPSHAEVEALLG